MSAAPPVFAIDGEFSIYRAAELAEALRTWMSEMRDASSLGLDLSAVSEMDSAGLQLVVSLQHTAQAQGMGFCITQASDAVKEVLALTALEHLLDPSVMQ